MAPVYRFVDTQWRMRADTNQARAVVKPGGNLYTGAYPVTSLYDETRYTLDEQIRAPLFFALSHPIGPNHSLPLTLPVPRTVQPGDRIALEVTTTLHGVRRRDPPFVAKVEVRDGRPAVAVELLLPDVYANRTVGVDVRGTVIPKDPALYHRTAPVVVPTDSYLDFAIGIQPAAWGEGPVEFQVRSCTGGECTTVFEEVLDPTRPDQRGWQDRRVDLGILAQREVSFSFETRLVSTKVDAFSLPVWANPTVFAPVTTERPGVNVILISLDTLSAMHLPTYGYEFATAPFIDEVLARQGMVFERAAAAATTTPQSHMSMFTSVQPCRHGVITGMEKLREEFVTLAEVLRAAAYETGAVTEDGWLGYEHGFGRGFNFYAENKSANVNAPDGQLDVTLAKARSWITRSDDKRFFLFLHTFQVHEPYSPPEKYRNLFRDRDGIEIGDTSPRAARELVAYDQEIRYADDQLREFFEFLRERGLLDNTVMIVTSDHGEEFFEHGLHGHGYNLHDEVTRVPLILWGPRSIPQGARRAETVGHIDVMPTILALAGARPPPQVTGRDVLDPRSPGGAPMAETRFTEARATGAVGEGYKRFTVLPSSFMVQHGTRKMIRYREPDGFRYEAYDLAQDPREQHNLLPAHAPVFEQMRRLLDDYEATCAEGLVGGSENERSRKIELDPEREEKLRALGYLD